MNFLHILVKKNFFVQSDTLTSYLRFENLALCLRLGFWWFFLNFGDFWNTKGGENSEMFKTRRKPAKTSFFSRLEKNIEFGTLGEKLWLGQHGLTRKIVIYPTGLAYLTIFRHISACFRSVKGGEKIWKSPKTDANLKKQVFLVGYIDPYRIWTTTKKFMVLPKWPLTKK